MFPSSAGPRTAIDQISGRLLLLSATPGYCGRRAKRAASAGPDLGENMIRRTRHLLTALLLSAAILAPAPGFAAAPPEMKQEGIANVDSHAKLVQVMIDQVFSYAEPGFQEIRTSLA